MGTLELIDPNALPTKELEAPVVPSAEAVEPQPENEEDLMLLDYPQCNFTEDKPVIENKARGRTVSLDPLNTFAYPLEVTAALREIHGVGYTEEDAPLGTLFTPRLMFSTRMTAPGSEWVQFLEHGGERVGVQSPRYAPVGNVISGDNAVDILRKVSGIGTSITFPLYHSGIWITLRAPGDVELVNFDFKLTMEKTRVGLSTTGQLLNSRSAVFSNALIDFILEHVTATNVANLGEGMVKALRSRIDMLDYSTLVWGILTTMYPNGYPWIFQCANPECLHEREAVLNFARMNFVDKTVLTEKQMEMLVRKRKVISDAEIAQYKEEFKLTDKNAITLTTGVKLHLRRCTVDEYAESGVKWVDVIERQHANALSNYTSEVEREAYLTSQIQARYMRKYEHFVEKISIPQGSEYLDIVDRDTIISALEALSTVNEDFADFENGVLSYIEANTIAVVGYPAVDCETCLVAPHTPEGRLRSIVPIAVDKVFFTLTRLRTRTMAQLALNP